MPQNSSVDICHWHELMQKFGLSDNNQTYHQLINAYSEKHRAYHSLEHIDACLRHLADIAHQAEHAHEIGLALWFHDAIYKPFSAQNEEDSAELARSFLIQNAVSSDIIQRVHDLIILTKDHAVPKTLDGKLMLDIDLSILGVKIEIYSKFENDVRREFKLVPSFIFKKKRKEILQNFLNRRRIYQTDYFFARLEEQAKKNLVWAIGRL